MHQLVVLKVRIAGSTAADIAVPCSQCPSGSVVGVQRNRIGLILDQFQIRQEGFRIGRQFGDACLFENSLVVDNTADIAHCRDAVNLIVEHLLIYEFVGILEVTVIADLFEVVAEFALVHGRRDAADVAPVSGRKSRGGIGVIIGDALISDLDVRIYGVELADVVLEVGIHQIGAVRQNLQICFQIGFGFAHLHIFIGYCRLCVVVFAGCTSCAAAGGCCCCKDSCQYQCHYSLFHSDFLHSDIAILFFFSRTGFRNLFCIPFFYDSILLYFYLKVKLNLSLNLLFCVLHKRILFRSAILNKQYQIFVV